MRKVKTERDKQIINRVLGIMERSESAEVQGYHARTDYNVNYAFAGFKSNKYFTSDRFIALDENFRRADGKSLKGTGIEFEWECFGINNQKALAGIFNNIIFPCFPDDLFKMQDDGSLGGDSNVECITQVMTREFIRNNYANFLAMFKLLKMYNISADSTGNCGMHVNISNACFGQTVNAQEQAIRKLYYFINHNFKLACSLLRRRANRTRYCGVMDWDAKTTPFEVFPVGHTAHYYCMNMSHYREGRIELRLVGGQKNYATFRNTMETIFFLIDACKKTPWDKMDDLEFLFKGCNNYVYNRLTLARDEDAITTDIVNAIANTVERVEYL